MDTPDIAEAVAAAANPKYKLDRKDFVKAPDGARLYRVVALRAFRDVEAGQRGGYIEGEHNLSHQGNCWVAGKAARVRQKARLRNDALACDFVDVSGNVEMWDQTLAHGHADLSGNVKMFDESEAGGYTQLFGSFEMRDRSRMGGHSVGCARASVSGNRFITGNCVLGGTFHIGGDGELDGGVWTGRKENDEMYASMMEFSRG
jgi:hypothetical protein